MAGNQLDTSCSIGQVLRRLSVAVYLRGHGRVKFGNRASGEIIGEMAAFPAI